MKISTKTLFAATALLVSGSAALAQDAPPDWTLTGYVDAQSDYRFRGISQNNRDVAPQGSLNLTGANGFYAGTWISRTDWALAGQNNNPAVELDIYGGKHFDLGGTDLNVEAYYYAYPDASQAAGAAAASYFEGIFQLTHAFDKLTLTGSLAVSPEFSLGGGTGVAVWGTAAYALTDWLSVSGNIGHQEVNAAPAGYTYGDIGATATWKMFSLDARYVTSDIGKVNCAAFWMSTKNACGGGFVATLTYNFALFP